MGTRYLRPILLITVLISTLAACSTVSSVDTSGSDAGDSSPIFRVSTDKPVVFLTIDDGAVRDPAMLTVLKEAKVPASLFLTSDYAVKDPDFFRSLRDKAGARIESHSIDHSNLKGRDLADQKRQICQPAKNYKKMFGKRPKLFRPPYGSYDETTFQAAEKCDVSHIVHWSAEIRDGTMNFASADRLRPGDIVLMHFGNNFEKDVREFIKQADRSGLRPALLEKHLS